MSDKRDDNIIRESYHAGYQAGYENGKRDAVRHGEIIKSGRRYPYCSLCGTSLERTYFKYCPYCGAKMDGKENKDGDISET